MSEQTEVSDEKIWNLFRSRLMADLREEDQFYNVKPLLAHYTSLDNIERILASQEIWLSNPLLMNDFEEIRFGIVTGADFIRQNELVARSLSSEERFRVFVKALDHQVSYFEREHLLDIYIFCLSEHTLGDTDGLLSMWRGYGGNGKGGAIVFDTAHVNAVEDTPFIIAKVEYGSLQTRRAWFNRIAMTFAETISLHELPTDKIYMATAALFDRLKLFSLFTKHNGFSEEREWRVAFVPNGRHHKILASMQHYLNGPRGIEPKLKFAIRPVEGLTADDLSLEKIVHSILLGPNRSSPLLVQSVCRMLDVIGRPGLKSRVAASSIPYRSP